MGEALAGSEARGTIDEAFRMVFPPEFRGRIKDVIIFRNLNEDAISRIVDLKIREIENEFTQNGVPIKLELDASARAWLIKHGHNPSEGARALEKLVKTSIREQLTLAHEGIGLARKTIYIEQDEGTQNLAFYFSERPDLFELPVPKLSDEAREQLLGAFYYRSGQEGITLDIQMAQFKKVKDRLLRAGEVPSAEAIKIDPEIQSAVKGNLIRRFTEADLDALIIMHNGFCAADLIDWNEVIAIPEIKETARKQLMVILAEKKPYTAQIAYLLQLSGAISIEQAKKLYQQLKMLTDSSSK